MHARLYSSEECFSFEKYLPRQHAIATSARNCHATRNCHVSTQCHVSGGLGWEKGGKRLVPDHVAARRVHLADDVEEKGLDVVVERLVVEEELCE